MRRYFSREIPRLDLPFNYQLRVLPDIDAETPPIPLTANLDGVKIDGGIVIYLDFEVGPDCCQRNPASHWVRDIYLFFPTDIPFQAPTIYLGNVAGDLSHRRLLDVDGHLDNGDYFVGLTLSQIIVDIYSVYLEASFDSGRRLDSK